VGQVRRHVEYLGRDGELELETDEGERWAGDDVGTRLVEDWTLDLPAPGSAERAARGDGREPRLVHKLVFSMPPGTPPDTVLAATRAVAREEFGLQHRYLMALHTDEPHPHVHVLVKALREDGRRLNIRKEDLRRWRASFAEQLRARGVAANATERAARGQSKKSFKDGIYRAVRRHVSTHVVSRLRRAESEVLQGVRHRRDPGSATLQDTAEQIHAGYLEIARQLRAQGDGLAWDVERFANRIHYPRSEQQIMRDMIHEHRVRAQERDREADRTR
jgi:hypothetical protein